MIDKEIDEAGNLVLSSGTFATVTEDQQIAQHWRIRLQHIKGEWFLDPSSGLDLFGRVLRRPFDVRSAEREFSRVTLATPGIQSIIKLNITPNNSTRTATVEIVAITRNAARIYFNEVISL